MSSVSVLESHQSDTDKAFGRIKRSAGYSLVNRGEAYWVRKPVLLKRLPPRPAPLTPGRHPASVPLCRAYIPDELPPAEIHYFQSCIFADPVKRVPGMLAFTRLWAERQEADFCRA